MNAVSAWETVSQLTDRCPQLLLYHIVTKQGRAERSWWRNWFLPCLDFHNPWSFCTFLFLPQGACCYRNLAGWSNCLYWDADTFQLFPCWRRASQKVFLVILCLDNAANRQWVSLLAVAYRAVAYRAVPHPEMNTGWERQTPAEQHCEVPWGTHGHFLKDKPRR